MSESPLFSPLWYRVKDVKLQLANDVEITRHVYRDRPTWVLYRRTNGECHRVGGACFELIDRFDGHRTVGELWEQALYEREHDAPTQDEWMGVLADLHAAELLVVDRQICAEQLFERRDKRRSREHREKHMNPLYLRFSLFDPNKLLDRLLPVARLLFSRAAATLWCCLMFSSALALIGHSHELVAKLASSTFPSPFIIALFFITYPFLKLVHELAHALAVKHFGGEVHDCGIALMVLVPMPFVNASASASFIRKRDRILVSAAGILVELGFAAIGALLWISTHGIAQDIGLVLVLIGGVSTLLINGNPLLRFDGYYVLADYLEIPNLATRAKKAVWARCHRWLSGQPDDSISVEDNTEKMWLLSYGVLSALYRTGLMLWISWWLYTRYPIFGSVLAVYAIVMSVVVPLGKGIATLIRDSDLHTPRPLTLISGIPLTLVAVLMWLPVPNATAARGVVWLPEQGVMRAASACEITTSSVQPGQNVTRGQPLYLCKDSELVFREKELKSRINEIDAKRRGLAVADPSQHDQLLTEKRALALALVEIREQIERQSQVALVDGLFDIPGTSAMEGRALSRGEVVAYVVPPQQRSVRIALDQLTIEAIDRALIRVEVRVEHNGATSHSTKIIAQTPRPSLKLVSPALSIEGGGDHHTAPGSNGSRALHPLFDMELAWPEELDEPRIGAHVTVRFVHVSEPLGPRIVASVRRLFIGQVES